MFLGYKNNKIAIVANTRAELERMFKYCKFDKIEETDKEYFIHNGEYVTEVPEPSYTEKRVAEYPSIQDQLDMLYWDKVNGTENWFNTISEIKAKYPKE